MWWLRRLYRKPTRITFSPDVVPLPARGADPVLIWTSALQAIYDQMRTEALASAGTFGATLYNRVIDTSNGNLYGDFGLWGALAYQMSGRDPVHVENAWEKLQPWLTRTTYDDNEIRENGMDRVLILDWLWPALTDARRLQMLTAIENEIIASSANPSLPESMPLRSNDSDQVIGVYFTIAFFYAAFGTVHAPAATHFARAFVGGFDQTGRNRTTIRNCVYDFMLMCSGGEFCESTEYNEGTMRLVLMGHAGMLTALGGDHFPEITAWIAESKNRNNHMMAPGKTQSFQWGDNQDARVFNSERFSAVSRMYNDPVARQTVIDLYAQYGTPSLDLWAKPFLLFNPYGAVAAESTLPLFFNCATGQGILEARTSWASTASMLCVHFPLTYAIGTLEIDHTVQYVADVQFYKDNLWGLTHPITYAGPSVTTGNGLNSIMLSGFATPKEWKGNVKAYRGTGWEFNAGTCGGSVVAFPYYQPPPSFWQEFSRQILWLQGAGDVDILIIADRTHVLDAKTLTGQYGGLSRYTAANQTKINASPMRMWRWHMPVSPTLTATTAEWAYGSATQHTRVTWLRSDMTTAIVNETTAWAAVNMHPYEKLFHITLAPPDAVGMDTTITVIEMGNPANFATVTAIDNGDTKGVKLVRAAQADRIAFFHTTAGAGTLTNQTTAGYPVGNPAVLAAKRLRTSSVSYSASAGTEIWWPETATGVVKEVV